MTTKPTTLGVPEGPLPPWRTDFERRRPVADPPGRRRFVAIVSMGAFGAVGAGAGMGLGVAGLVLLAAVAALAASMAVVFYDSVNAARAPRPPWRPGPPR